MFSMTRHTPGPVASPPRLAAGLLERYSEEMRLRNYSPRSIKTYLSCVRVFLRTLGPVHPREVVSEQVRAFLLGVAERGSRSLVDQHVSALKFLYVTLYHRDPARFSIPRPRRESALPRVPAREEILAIADALENRKHRLVVLMLYATGLRVSEIVAAKVGDLELPRLLLHVRSGKGRKDRQTVVSELLVADLYWLVGPRAPEEPLFPSSRGGTWSARSVQHVVARAARRAGVEGVTCHSFRHAFATHLLEGGTQLRLIQGLLGHQSIVTTTRYTRMRSPGASSLLSPL